MMEDAVQECVADDIKTPEIDGEKKFFS